MTTRLIATDEAGYGPKLGPLVVVATSWLIPDESSAADAVDSRFSPLRTPCSCGGQSIRVDDSKRVFKTSDGLDVLHAIASTAVAWAGHQQKTLDNLIPIVAATDVSAIESTPWLSGDDKMQFLPPEVVRDVIRKWSSGGAELETVRCRLITAREFNRSCDSGRNKADLLSESTLGLVRQLSQSCGQLADRIVVHCDRHGGRRYYGSVVQHMFSDSQLQIVTETSNQSRYRLTGGHAAMEISFTVKGDAFTPVALSSLLAKYLRERMMQRFNRDRHRGPRPLRPTAGYPTDADRFLRDIVDVIAAESIDPPHLIRCR